MYLRGYPLPVLKFHELSKLFLPQSFETAEISKHKEGERIREAEEDEEELKKRANRSDVRRRIRYGR